MDKLNELKALAELAKQLEENGHYIEANTVHNQFIRLAQKKTHPVLQGESLSLIAKKNGISVDALMKANGLTSSTIYPGDVLTIPSPTKPSGPFDFIQKGIDTVTDMLSGPKEAPKKQMAPKKPTAPKKQMAPKKNDPETYPVSQGDSLSTIARNHGMTLQALLNKNPGIDPSKKLYQGQPINIK